MKLLSLLNPMLPESFLVHNLVHISGASQQTSTAALKFIYNFLIILINPRPLTSGDFLQITWAKITWR